MPKLKLSAVPDDKPVKLTIELPAAVHRDLAAYAEALAKETGQSTVDPVWTCLEKVERHLLSLTPVFRTGLG